MKQGLRILKRKIFSKPIVFFLDDVLPSKRRDILLLTKANLNGTPLEWAVYKPRLVVSNISRGGERLTEFVARGSTSRPHFYTREAFKDALVYGESDYIFEENTHSTDKVELGEL